MIKQFNAETLTEYYRRLVELNIHKNDVIQLIYTGDERMKWVCFYWVEKE